MTDTIEKNSMTDIEIVRETIELFAVNYFDTIEMSGNVKAENKEDINYFSINLTEVKLEDEGLDKFHQSLIKYLKDWGQKNLSNFNDYISISKLTIEYLLPQKDGANQNKSKHVKLFYIPSNYYQANQKNKGKTYSEFVLKVLNIWDNVILRNTIIILIPTILLILISICDIHADFEFRKRLIKSYNYINMKYNHVQYLILVYPY